MSIIDPRRDAVHAMWPTRRVRRASDVDIWDVLVARWQTFRRMLSGRPALYRSRRDLEELSDDLLRDIGVTRAEARAEAARPFFEA